MTVTGPSIITGEFVSATERETFDLGVSIGAALTGGELDRVVSRSAAQLVGGADFARRVPPASPAGHRAGSSLGGAHAPSDRAWRGPGDGFDEGE